MRWDDAAHIQGRRPGPLNFSRNFLTDSPEVFSLGDFNTIKLRMKINHHPQPPG